MVEQETSLPTRGVGHRHGIQGRKHPMGLAEKVLVAAMALVLVLAHQHTIHPRHGHLRGADQATRQHQRHGHTMHQPLRSRHLRQELDLTTTHTLHTSQHQRLVGCKTLQHRLHTMLMGPTRIPSSTTGLAHLMHRLQQPVHRRLMRVVHLMRRLQPPGDRGMRTMTMRTRGPESRGKRTSIKTKQSGLSPSARPGNCTIMMTHKLQTLN